MLTFLENVVAILGYTVATVLLALGFGVAMFAGLLMLITNTSQDCMIVHLDRFFGI